MLFITCMHEIMIRFKEEFAEKYEGVTLTDVDDIAVWSRNRQDIKLILIK